MVGQDGSVGRNNDKVNPSRESGPGNFRQRVVASVVRAI
jgi:hypothetical protein